MKLVVRALVLSIAVSGAAASVVSAHATKSTMVESHQKAIFSHQVMSSELPQSLCIPHCS